MADLKIDERGDISFTGTHDLDFVEGVNSAGQQLEIYLETHVGENMFHPDRGVNWLRLEASSDVLSLIEAVIRDRLQRHELVDVVERVSVDYIERDVRLIHIDAAVMVNEDIVQIEVDVE